MAVADGRDSEGMDVGVSGRGNKCRDGCGVKGMEVAVDGETSRGWIDVAVAD